jgi:hypothetical protein
MKTLSCGHPDSPNHLIDGKCGTCETAKSLEELSASVGGILRERTLNVAKLFRSGQVLFDRTGKTLIEWEKEFKTLPQPEP